MESKNSRMDFLSRGKIPKALLKLGIPTMIGMMTSALYNLVDTFFVGKLGTAQTGAVSVVFPISVIFLGIGLLFGNGASAYLARLLGAKRYKEANECASTAVVTGLVAAGILATLLLLFLTPVLQLFGATDTMLPYAKDYAVVFIVGLVFNVFNIMINNIIIAEGATMYSMIDMLLGGIINIFLDPLLILTINMGVKGAAIATLLSRCVSLALYLVYIFSGKSQFHFSIRNCKPGKEVYSQIYKIGVPMLAYQLLCSLALELTNTRAVIYGDSAVAAMGVVNKILSLGFMIIMGFLKGYQTFVGFNYGAKNPTRVQEATKTSLLWTTVFSVTAALLLIIFRSPLMHAFTKSDSAMMQIGETAILVSSITFMSMGYQLVYSTMFMGLGRAKEGGLVSVGRQGMFFVPLIMILPMCFGLNGIIFSQPVADVCSLVLVIVLVRKYKAKGSSLTVSEAEHNPAISQ